MNRRQHGQLRADRARRGARGVDGVGGAKARRAGGNPVAATDRGLAGQLRARQLHAAASEAARLICRLEAAVAVERLPVDVRWVDDDDLDRRIKGGDPAAPLDAITFAIHELRTVARWLEMYIEVQGH